MCNYNINYLNKSDEDDIKFNITPYALKVFCPIDETRVSASAKTHFDYLINDYETNGNELCFDTPYVKNLDVTKTKCGKILSKLFKLSTKIITSNQFFVKLFPLFFGISYTHAQTHKTCFR